MTAPLWPRLAAHRSFLHWNADVTVGLLREWMAAHPARCLQPMAALAVILAENDSNDRKITV